MPETTFRTFYSSIWLVFSQKDRERDLVTIWFLLFLKGDGLGYGISFIHGHHRTY